jgi:UV DNA damage endonuclease
MTYSRFCSLPREQALGILSARILNNFVVTEKIIRYCHEVGFSSYRLSSDLTPILNHPEVNLKLQDLPDSSEIFSALESIKKAIQETKLKVSAHPSEYISLTSSNPSVISNSIRDLQSHAELFDLIGLPNNYEAPLNIHCRQDGDPESVSSFFIKNFEKLPDNIKNRLVLEVNDNKEGTWTISNLCRHFNQKIGIPITFDNLHHLFCHGDIPEPEAFQMAYSTWNTVPVFHYSEGVNNTRKHAEYATALPNGYEKPVFWDVELKAKDLAILKMLGKNE